jgi:hypothetical protein
MQNTLSANLGKASGDTQDFIVYALISIDLEISSRDTLLEQSALSPQDQALAYDEIMLLQNNLEGELS